MAGTSYDDVIARKRRWKSLILVAKLVSEGKVELEELVRRYPLDRRGKNPISEKPIKNIPNKEKNPSSPCKHEKLLEVIRKHIIINNNNNVRDLQLPILPEAIKSKIVEIGGDLESVVLIIEKSLTATDVNRTHCRLSVPVRKVREIRFLSADEVEFLMAEDGQRIETVLIQPSLESCNVDFSVWKSIMMYVLKNGWCQERVEGGGCDSIVGFSEK